MIDELKQKQDRVKKAIEKYRELSNPPSLKLNEPSKEMYNYDEAVDCFGKSFLDELRNNARKKLKDIKNEHYDFYGDCLMYAIVVYISKVLDEAIFNYFGDRNILMNIEGAYLDNVDFSNCELMSSMFDSCSLKCVKFENSVLISSSFRYSNLDKVTLIDSDLSCADFNGATFLNEDYRLESEIKNCNLSYSSFNNVKAMWFSFQNIEFDNVNLQNTFFDECEFFNVDFKRITTDKNTTFEYMCEFDSMVDFGDVDLSIVKNLKARTGLIYSIRRLSWERKFIEHCTSEKQISRMGEMCNENDRKYMRRKRFKRKIYNVPIKAFWYCSDYGYSTKRIIKSFFSVAIFFAIIYWMMGFIDYLLLGGLDNCWGCVANLFQVEELVFSPFGWHGIFRTLYFSIVTMTTLGFGDVYADPSSIMGYVLLSLQVITGYVLLGILITRVSVLFTIKEIPEIPHLAEEHKDEEARIRKMLLWGALSLIALLGWAKLLYVYLFRI